MKKRFHHAIPPNAYFWRDKAGHEVDCMLEEGKGILPIEIKSSSTITSDLFDGLVKWSQLADFPSEKGMIVYAGQEEQSRKTGHAVSWASL